MDNITIFERTDKHFFDTSHSFCTVISDLHSIVLLRNQRCSEHEMQNIYDIPYLMIVLTMMI